MYYQALADELLHIRMDLLQVPAAQQLSGILRGELFVLNYLYNRDEGIHPKELSEKLSVSTARIASLLNHMEGKHLVVRETDPSDFRQVLVRLTPDGSDAIRRCRSEVLASVERMLESLGPDNTREYIRIQEKIYSNYMKTRKNNYG